jgi:hypothetical protein
MIYCGKNKRETCVTWDLKKGMYQDDVYLKFMMQTAAVNQDLETIAKYPKPNYGKLQNRGEKG